MQDAGRDVIWGNPFTALIEPFTIDDNGIHTNFKGKEVTFKLEYPKRQTLIPSLKEQSSRKKVQINYLKEEFQILNIKEKLDSGEVKGKIKSFQDLFHLELCNDLPTTFWERKRHEVTFPYEDNFHDSLILTKARPIQISKDLVIYCKKEIQDLLEKNLIRPSKSPWSCSAFYIFKALEIECGALRLLINYKLSNKVLKWIWYPIPNKKDLLKRLYQTKVYSKFDLKSGFW